MPILQKLFDSNRDWASNVKVTDPKFFESLATQQTPEYLWIGCADSRVPANQITGLTPGDIFVHRNIANQVIHTDLNCLSVIEYAVAALKVKHIIVCGHYGCGGVAASLQANRIGVIDNWLRHIRDVRQKHDEILSKIKDDAERLKTLCELNVIEQVNHVCQTTIVQNAWEAGQELSVHGLVYGLEDGHLHDLNTCIKGPDEISEIYRFAVSTAAD